MNKSTFPTLLGIIILVVGVAMGVFLLQQQQVFRLGASPDEAPKDVHITNNTDTSFTVSWTTDSETVGYVEWGEGNSTDKNAHAESDGNPLRLHSVTVRNAQPDTTFSFKINSNGTSYDNTGVPWNTKTSPTLPASTPRYISGTVLDATGQPATNVLVYVTGSSIAPMSAVTSQNGEWLIPIGNARTPDLKNIATINDNTLLEILVHGGLQGIATAQAYPQTANPTPPMTLGQIYDLRDSSQNASGENPDSQVNLPVDTQKTSKFEVSNVPSTDTDETVTLESLEDGEVIYTTQPEFFGEGPQGADVTITVESDIPYTGNVTVDNSGSWQWSPPTNLDPGTHTITISWRDAAGILRSIKRSFVVNAAENSPAFESTPSGSTTSPSPTPTASPTTKPTATPTVKPSLTPSPTPSLTPSPTPTKSPTPVATNSAELPDSGYGLYTVVFMALGLLLFSGGLLLNKKLN